MSRGPIPDFPRDRPQVPDVVDRFVAYYRENPAWGSLHVVMDDGNWGSVDFCKWWAMEQIPPDREGWELADILGQMTTTQRRKLAGECEKCCRSTIQPPT
jgi:hypothetical protein